MWTLGSETKAVMSATLYFNRNYIHSANGNQNGVKISQSLGSTAADSHVGKQQAPPSVLLSSHQSSLQTVFTEVTIWSGSYHHHHHHHRCMLDVGHCPLYPDRSIRGRALLYSWTSSVMLTRPAPSRPRPRPHTPKAKAKAMTSRPRPWRQGQGHSIKAKVKAD